MSAIAQYYRDDPATMSWLKDSFHANGREEGQAEVAMLADKLYPQDLDEQMRKWLWQREQSREVIPKLLPEVLPEEETIP